MENVQYQHQHQHDAPEVVTPGQHLPEVVQPHYNQQQFQQQAFTGSQYTHSPSTPPVKSPETHYQGFTPTVEQSTLYTPTPGPHTNDGASYIATAPTLLSPPEKSRKTICGFASIVFILSVIIGILSVAIIGLAAGTGVVAVRAASAESRAEELSSSLAAMGATSTSSSEPTGTAEPVEENFDSISNRCSTQGESVSGSTYTPQFFDRPTFRMFCNSDTPLGPLMSLFTADFNACMDACASYTSYLNETCEAVSFVPPWTNKTTAIAGTAPGNCYLKPGPQNRTALTDSTYIEVHAAILDT